jgi:hypothetical protein
MNRASAALTGIAADVGAGQAQIIAQKMYQQRAWFDISFICLSIYSNVDFHRIPPPYFF